MPRITKPYDPRIGPVLNVKISDPLRSRNDFEDERSELVVMLIDTGASDSSVSGDVIDRLRLEVLALHDVVSFSANKRSHQYLADLDIMLDSQFSVMNCTIFRFDAPYSRVGGLIGRDILNKGRFTLDGNARQFTLEFP